MTLSAFGILGPPCPRGSPSACYSRRMSENWMAWGYVGSTGRSRAAHGEEEEPPGHRLGRPGETARCAWHRQPGWRGIAADWRKAARARDREARVVRPLRSVGRDRSVHWMTSGKAHLVQGKGARQMRKDRVGMTKDVGTAVDKELGFDPMVDAAHISVRNIGGDVTLTGTVPSYSIPVPTAGRLSIMSMPTSWAAVRWAGRQADLGRSQISWQVCRSGRAPRQGRAID